MTSRDHVPDHSVPAVERPPPFGARLAAAVAERGPLCVGIDPHAELLRAWGLTDDIEGLRRFTDTVVDALAGTVAVLKPQSAFFERHGSRGLLVLEDAVARSRDAGALMLLDAKRGDIGSTMAGYAAVLTAGHPMQVDALTVSPYLGPGSLQPAVAAARQAAGGLFVLARTSNPDAATFQSAQVAGDRDRPARSVAQAVVDAVGAWNTPDRLLGDPAPDPASFADLQRRWGPHTGSFGVVVGATLTELDLDLAGVRGPVLAPGLGAQGGRPADLRRLFGADQAVVPTVSRDVLAAGPSRTGLRAAAERWALELQE